MYIRSCIVSVLLCFVLLQFLTDVLDSLFSIFMENSESDTYDPAVFSALVCRLQTTMYIVSEFEIECLKISLMRLSNTVYERTHWYKSMIQIDRYPRKYQFPPKQQMNETIMNIGGNTLQKV